MQTLSTIFKWLGRISAVLLFLFWGAFFVEHISEWFMHPEQGYPPARIWVSMFFHFVMLIGLATMVKWDKLGSIIMVIGTIAFFASIGYKGFPFIALINLISIIFYGIFWITSSKGKDQNRGTEIPTNFTEEQPKKD